MAPITLLSAPPVHMTREQFDEFQAATPADGRLVHDPVLHLHQTAVTVTVEPPIQGFALSAEGNAKGDVYVTERAVSFFDPSTSKGFSIPYPTLSLHAVSRQAITSASSAEAAGGERPCVYCQLDESEGADYETMQDDDDNVAETKELSFFPDDHDAVQAIYAAMSKCAALYPSTDQDSGRNGSTDPDWGSLLAQASANANGGIHGDDGEWEDADEGEDGEADGAAGRQRPDYVTPSARFNPY